MSGMKSRTCSTCGGRGTYDAIGMEACSKWAGTGHNLHSKLLSEPCMKCYGNGRQSYCRRVICLTCNESGIVYY